MSRRCRIKTSTGKTCTRQSQSGKTHCWQHQPQTGGEYQTVIYNVINWNIMDHQSTEFSRLGNLEQPLEYLIRYKTIINQIYKTAFLQQKIVDVFCLEEVTPEFINLLKQNPYLIDWYHLLEHTKTNPSGKSFSLLTLIRKTLPVSDYSKPYQEHYEGLNTKNRDQPSRTQIFLINNQLVLIHVHLTGLPGDYGDQLRRQSLQTVLNYVQTQMPNHTRRVVIGDFNETNVSTVLGSVIEASGLRQYVNTTPTSFHRFIRHSLIPTTLFQNDSPPSECIIKYEDKKGGQIYQKVDHLLHSHDLQVTLSDQQPTNFLQLESPYSAQVDSDNIEVPDEVVKCKTYGQLNNPRLIKNPSQVRFEPNIFPSPTRYQGVFYPGGGWPSDHRMMEYKVSWTTNVPLVQVVI